MKKRIETNYKPIVPPPRGYKSKPVLRIIQDGELTEMNILTKKTFWERWEWWIYAVGFALLIAYKIYSGDWQL
ncbi:hypothetical protein KC887_00575 [Candidatus Kaiserbacteria bacterium]|nr:hypothetical protein [Candidatus Kaiserbacteria bacterium]